LILILQLIFNKQLDHLFYASQLLRALALKRIPTGAIPTLGACSISGTLAHGSPLAITRHCGHRQYDDGSGH
jgi:hypothetical protein